MYRFLLDLPTWLLGTLLIVAACLIAAAETLVFRKVRVQHQEGDNDVLVGLFAGAGVLYAILLAFVVFALFDSYAGADKTTTNEGATLTSLYFASEQYPPPLRAELQHAIREYTTSVVEDEYPAMQDSHGSARTRARLDDLHAAQAALHSTDSTTALVANRVGQQLDEVTTLRAQRIAASRSGLPDTLWFVLIFGALVTTVLGVLGFVKTGFYHLVGNILLASVLGAILFLVMTLDKPFTGDAALRPEAYESSLRVYTDLDKLHQGAPAAVQASPSPTPARR